MAAVIADEVRETPDPSLREQIIAAREEVTSREEAPETEAKQPKEPESKEATEQRARDESGKFVRKAESPTESTPAAAASPQAPPPSPQATQTPAPQSPTLAPQGWTPAGKAVWAQVPEAARAEIARREAEQHKLATRVDEERQIARSFNQITEQHADVIRAAGVHPLRVYQDFLGILNVLTTGRPEQKAALIRDVAIRQGLDLRALAGMGAQQFQQPGQASLPPSAVPPEIAQAAREWHEFKARQQQEARQLEEQQQQQTLEEIVAFRSKPEARFFDAVKDQMVALLQVGAVQSLEEAYEQAVWTRPDIRQILQGEQDAARQAAEQKRLKTVSARNKGVSVRGGVGGSPQGATENRSLREDLQAALAEARGRV